ncbi:MAG: methyltransferase domain-containing protein [Bacilli bacterium]|nr:methyltransferase domain-containing protein [Bacilli bacterium]
MSEAFERLKPFLRKRRSLNYLISILNYDISTTCPRKSIEDENDLMLTYVEESAELMQNKEFVEAIRLANDDPSLNFRQRAVVDNLYEEVSFFDKVDIKTYSAWQKDIHKCDEMWRSAKENNDFASFLPYWEKAIEATREMAKVRQKGEKTLYDVLLNQYERGNNSEIIDSIFNPLKEFLVKKLPEVLRIQAEHEIPKVAPMDKDLQRKMSIDVLNRIGYDLDRGALRETMHPFSDSLSKNDARITTNLSDDFRDNLYSVIHEAGHAIEFQWFGDEQYEDYSEMLASSAICETHSRFYENILGRSEPFLKGFYRDYNDKYLHLDVSEDDFVRMVRVVEPSLIRTESDEFTYCLHIIIRYEIEKELINGTLKPMDAPKVWNKKYKEYLGVDVPSFSMGILQDIHWASGLFGYFPSYALGNIYGAMIFERMEDELPMDELLLKGDLVPIREWFAQNDFRYDCLPPRVWLRKVTGSDIEVNAFIDYLSKRYLNFNSTMERYFSSLAPSWVDRNEKSVEEADAILSPLELKEGERVLDIACGKGIMTGHIARHTKTKVLGIDLSEKMIELAKKDYEGNDLVEFQNVDFLKVDGEFDKLLMFDAFPHFQDVDALKEQFHRLIKKGGLVLVVHDLGKDRLNSHHANMNHDLYRDILSAKEEAKRFEEYFDVILTIDEDNRYGFLLRGK